MAVFFTCIILVGSGITLLAFFLILAEKHRMHDYRTDAGEKKEDLLKVIEDADVLISEMNRFSDYVVTRLEEKNDTLSKTIAEADFKVESLNSETLKAKGLNSEAVNSANPGSKHPNPEFSEKRACALVPADPERPASKDADVSKDADSETLNSASPIPVDLHSGDSRTDAGRPDQAYSAAYDEAAVSKILEEERLENPDASSQARKGKVIPFDQKRREIVKLAKSGLDSTEIARRLNCGKGEIELIAKLIQ